MEKFKRNKIATLLLSVTVCVVCLFCFVSCKEKHTHLFMSFVNENCIKTETTCTTKAVYYVSCACGEKSEETFEYGEPLGHDFAVYVSNRDATCAEDGTETSKCNRDGCEETHTRVQENSALGHDYATFKSTEEGHWKECACGAKTELEAHRFDQENINEKYFVSAATAVERAKYHKTCVCGEVSEEIFEAGCPLYHCKGEDGACIYCNETKYFCEHAELEEFLLIDNAPMERCAMFVCEACHKTFYKSVDYADLGIPVVCLDGDIASATKTNKVKINFSYFGEKNFQGTGTVKWQGGSSIAYPKKNYTLKLDDKIKVKDSWGKQKKYCLKANYIDFSQARNVVSGKIYGQIVRNRNMDDEISSLINGGAIDGFPVLIFNNGNYVGLYTFNIPKDKWLFGMSDSDEKNQAILMGDGWTNSVFLKEPIAEDLSNGWELEYYSNEESEIDNDGKWVIDSFNDMMRFLIDNDGQSFKDGIREYINVERSIDSMLYTYAMCAGDNTAKNILWITYDGKVWQPSVYDMDGTWGLVWDGTVGYDPESTMLFNSSYNLLWTRLFENYQEEIALRWKELREEILTLENIEREFSAFFDQIPSLLYKTEKLKWQAVPSQETNNLEQIMDWTAKRLVALDNSLASLVSVES